jgi:hypothetical protein
MSVYAKKALEIRDKLDYGSMPILRQMKLDLLDLKRYFNKKTGRKDDISAYVEDFSITVRKPLPPLSEFKDILDKAKESGRCKILVGKNGFEIASGNFNPKRITVRKYMAPFSKKTILDFTYSCLNGPYSNDIFEGMVDSIAERLGIPAEFG